MRKTGNITLSEKTSNSAMETACAPYGRFSKSSDQVIEVDLETESRSAVTFTIVGMQCQVCAQNIETALLNQPGVERVSVEFAKKSATICFDPAATTIADLKMAVTSAGYNVSKSIAEETGAVEPCCEKQSGVFSNPRAYLFGTLAAFGIVGIYLGMNTLTANWYFAKDQFKEYQWWIIILSIGLAVQVMLFTMFRSQVRGMRMRAANSSMAASGGVSVVSMMACCSHYLATFIPVIGLSFLSTSAVAALAQYQPYFFLTGVISILFGIGLMLRMVVKHRMI